MNFLLLESPEQSYFAQLVPINGKQVDVPYSVLFLEVLFKTIVFIFWNERKYTEH